MQGNLEEISMAEAMWACTSCGRTGNTAAFCGMCGASRPVEPVAAPAHVPAAMPVHDPSQVSVQVPAPAYPQAGGVSEAPGIALMPGESTTLDVSFSPHLILQHLRTRVLLTDRRVVVQSPHAIFGIVPMGYACGSAPLDAIDQINHGHMMRGTNILAGTIALLLGIVMLFSFGPVALLLLLAAAFCFATARSTGIFFDTGGNHLLAAAGRGRDIATIEETAQRVIEAIQAAHDR